MADSFSNTDERARQDGANPEPAAPRQFPGFDPGFQAALERLAIAPRRPARSQHAGSVPSRWRGRALEFADYRPYSPGDDPRLVDWRGYARLGRLFLKQYEEERSRTLTLLLDASASMDWGEGETHKGRFARRMAAALAWISLSRHEPVRGCLLGEGGCRSLPPVSVRAGAATFFNRLGDVREGGGMGLGASVRDCLRGRIAGPTILITDLLDPEWLEALRSLASTGEGTVIHLLSPSEWDPPLGDEVELEDSETGELRPTRFGPLELADYRSRLDRFVSEVRQQCGRLGLAYLALNSGTPLREVMLRQLPAAGVLAG